jgi:radical SAM superfamily enzyme YgiQ (UPF0313 family)
MKLLLVDNLLFEGGVAAPRYDLQPHLGLMSLVSVARRAGHQADVLDPKRLLSTGRLCLDGSLYERLADEIASQDADVVGFTALGCNIHCVVQTANALRRMRPGRPVLLGGPHATILHRELLDRFSSIDMIARGEAEETLLPLLDALGGSMRLEGIAGIAYRDPDGRPRATGPAPLTEDLDRLPEPAYDAYPLGKSDLGEIRVEAGRGCPFSCTFCSTASFFGRRFRLKSAARIASEMDMLSASYGFRRFKLSHDLFTVNRAKVVEFCATIEDRGYEWSCSARMDCVDAELLNRMSAAGCRDIYFGVEAGSERLQEISRKRLDLGLVVPTLSEAAGLEIRTTTSFITGYPEEDAADHDATLDMVGACHLSPGGLNDAQLHLLTPEPGTDLMARYSDTMALDDHVSEFNFPRLAPSDDALLASHREVFPNHYHYPSGIPRGRLILATTLWPALYEAGRPTLACLLAPYAGRLSALLADVAVWAEETGRLATSRAGDLDLLAEHADARLGARHAVTSVARFAAAFVPLAFGRKRTCVSANVQGGLCLSSKAAVLRACHDVPRLLARVQDAGVAAALEAPGALKDRLLLRSDGDVRMFDIDSETARLLSFFEAGSTYEDACREALSRPDAPLPDREGISRLLALGALEVIPSRRAGAVA